MIKKVMYYLIICLLILCVSGCESKSKLTSVGENNSSQVNNDASSRTEQNRLYNYEHIYSFKNISVSDTDELKELINQLQYAKDLPISVIEYNEATGLRIDYRMNLTKGQKYQANHQKMMADAVILFALMDDLNSVEINLVQAGYSYGGVPITREVAGQALTVNIGALGKTKETFLSEMPQKIAALKWNPDVMSVITYEHIMGFDD